MSDSGPGLPPTSRALIGRFVDALWIEDGLARLTLEAYRRDLTLYAHWLADTHGRALDESAESDLLGYTAHRHADSRATTANRRQKGPGGARSPTSNWLPL